MNPEIKKKWLAALRGGEFEQCTGYLKDGGKYCCLGVLGEIQGMNLSDDVEEYLLPHEFAADLTREEQEELAKRNDGDFPYQAHDFDRVANHIRKHL